MLKMSAKPSRFRIAKPCSRFAMRSARVARRATATQKKGTKQKRPVRFFQTGRFERNSFLNYGAGYKIAFTRGSIQLFAATGSKISAATA